MEEEQEKRNRHFLRMTAISKKFRMEGLSVSCDFFEKRFRK